MSWWSAAGPISSSRGTVCGEARQLTQMFSGIVSEMGVVTANGSGLAVVEALPASVTVSLIPQTRGYTTAGSWSAGSRVNIEADLVARYVQRGLAGRNSVTAPAGAVVRKG